MPYIQCPDGHTYSRYDQSEYVQWCICNENTPNYNCDDRGDFELYSQKENMRVKEEIRLEQKIQDSKPNEPHPAIVISIIVVGVVIIIRQIFK